MYIHVHTYVYMYIHIYKHICTCAYIYIHTYVSRPLLLPLSFSMYMIHKDTYSYAYMFTYHEKHSRVLPRMLSNDMYERKLFFRKYILSLVSCLVFLIIFTGHISIYSRVEDVCGRVRHYNVVMRSRFTL